MKSKNRFLLKISLLSISLVLTSASAISSAIPLMRETFSQMPLSAIEMISTVPSIMVMLFVLLCNPISQKIGSKNTVLLGLIIALICGPVPMFTSNYVVIILSRAGLGIGFGLFNSLAVSLISDFYQGEERTRMIGYQTAFQSLGSSVIILAVGQLIKNGWQFAFGVYMIILPILILFALFVPEPQRSTEKEISKTLPKVNYRECLPVLKYVFLMFLILSLYTAIQLKTPTLITDKKLGTVTNASVILSILQICSMLVGFLFGAVYKKIGKYVLPLSVGCMGISFFIISVAGNLTVLCAGAVIGGVASPLFIPYLFNKVSEISSDRMQTLSASLLIVGAQISAFLAPVTLNLLGKIPFGMDETSQTFFACAILFTMFSVGSLIMLKISLEKHKKIINNPAAIKGTTADCHNVV
ncbi:MAG: MFS transporter [Lachnospiraceae bacterium]|nr:MFS transporter [Lachnospiraceae bacterium]MDD3616985.1 MFS transporter [Lachnospiraceae bacterium]